MSLVAWLKGSSPHLTLSPFWGSERRPNYLLLKSSLDLSSSELKLKHQILTLSPKCLQKLDIEAILIQSFLQLQKSLKSVILSQEHLTPLAGRRDADCLADRGALVGAEPLLNSGNCVHSLEGWEGAGPSFPRSRWWPGLSLVPSVPAWLCSGRPSLRLCAFKVRSSVSFQNHVGATFLLGSKPVPFHESVIDLLPWKLLLSAPQLLTW